MIGQSGSIAFSSPGLHLLFTALEARIQNNGGTSILVYDDMYLWKKDITKNAEQLDVSTGKKMVQL